MTVLKAHEYLAARGFLLHRLVDKTYRITNFRGGKCFEGTLAELKAHLKVTYYGEVGALSTALNSFTHSLALR